MKESRKIIKCSSCGAELSDDAKFCSYRGNKIEATMPPLIKWDEGDIIPMCHSKNLSTKLHENQIP